MKDDSTSTPGHASVRSSGSSGSSSSGNPPPEETATALDASQLTERQRKVLEVIRTSVAERGYPPSIREIGDAVG